MAEKIEWYGEIPIEDTWITFANQSDKGYIYDDPNNAHKITATTDVNCASLYDVIKFVVNFNGNVYSRTCKVTFKQESGATDYCYISQNGTDFEQIWKHAPKTNTSNTNPTDAVIAQSSNETSNNFEVAVGNFNRTRPNLLFSVGNGKDENHRSNSFEVDNEKLKAKNANIEFLTANTISATTFVNENGEPIVGGSKVSYEPTITKDDDNSYEIGRLTIDNVENVIYGRNEDKKEENPTVTYIHIAYSNSSDDWAKESQIKDPSSPFYKKNDWKYIGFNSSLVKSDSDLTYNDYTWSTYQGKLDISGAGYKLVPIQEEINAIPSENNGKVTKTINAFLTYRLVKTGESGYTEEEFDDTKVVKIYVGNNGNETTILASYFTGSRINDNKYWRITGSTPYYDNLQYYIVTCENNDGSQILDQRIVYVKMPTSTIFKVTEDAVRISQQASKDVRDLSDNVVTHTNFENDYNRYASSLTDSFVSVETFNDVEEQIQRTNELIRTSSGNTFIVQELKEKLGSTNLFGFSKGIIFWSDTLPDIQKYGFVANSKLGRIKNLGLNGENGDYTITFNAYTNYGGELKVNFNLCDVDAKEGIQTLTTTIQHYELHYTLEDNEYIYSDKNYGYNGFFDCERVDEKANGIIYVSNLKIEKGALSTKFSIAPEDVENFNNGNLVSPTEWTFNKLTKTDEKVEGYDVYVNTENPTVSSPTIDYIYLNGVDIEDETPYTLSFWVKSNMEGAVITSHFYWNGGIINGDWGSVAGDGKTNTILQTTWNKYYIHWYTCLSSINSTSNTKYVLPLRISYGENNSVNGSAKIYIAGVKFEKGFVNDNSKLPNSIKSQIQQTASSIKLSVQKNVENKLVETGIDIKNNVINLKADTTNFLGSDGLPYIKVEQDKYGMPHLIFYAADGTTPVYDLGHTGLQKLITDANDGKFISKICLVDIGNYQNNQQVAKAFMSIKENSTIPAYKYIASYEKVNGETVLGNDEAYNNTYYKSEGTIENIDWLSNSNNFIPDGYYARWQEIYFQPEIGSNGSGINTIVCYQISNGKIIANGYMYIKGYEGVNCYFTDEEGNTLSSAEYNYIKDYVFPKKLDL